MRIAFYINRNNRSPILRFIDVLSKEEQAIIYGCFKNIEALGLSCHQIQFRHIRGKLWEIKMRTATSGYRIFYCVLKSDIMVLLHVYKKQSQKAPLKEIQLAEKRMLEVLNETEIYYA